MKSTKFLKTTVLVLMLSRPGYGQWSDLSSGITNDLEDVHFINNTEGWAVGRQGKIIHTTNSGTSWTLQNSGTTNDLNDVFMVNSSCGYAVGDGGKTLKYNGSTWSTVTIGFSQDMFGVYFLSPTEGWISGDWGRIMYTNNGGSSWTTQMDNSIYSNTFNDLNMIDASDGWAVGSSGRVLHFDGTNWLDVSNPASSGLIDLYSVSFSSSSNGFMTGDDSKVYEWDGSSWNEHSTSLPDNSFHVYSVCMINSSLAYAACSAGFGGEGYILKYNGVSWTTSYNYTGMGTELFTGIHFPSAGKGYAVANTGIIKTLGTASAVEETNTQQMNLEVYPNPFENNTKVTYELVENTEVSITLYDVSGKQVSVLFNQKQTAGKHVYQMNGDKLTAGVYYIKVEAGNYAAVQEIVK